MPLGDLISVSRRKVCHDRETSHMTANQADTCLLAGELQWQYLQLIRQQCYPPRAVDADDLTVGHTEGWLQNTGVKMSMVSCKHGYA